jgi:hypothetical protein
MDIRLDIPFLEFHLLGYSFHKDRIKQILYILPSIIAKINLVISIVSEEVEEAVQPLRFTCP